MALFTCMDTSMDFDMESVDIGRLESTPALFFMINLS